MESASSENWLFRKIDQISARNVLSKLNDVFWFSLHFRAKIVGCENCETVKVCIFSHKRCKQGDIKQNFHTFSFNHFKYYRQKQMLACQEKGLKSLKMSVYFISVA
ncbi:hypothetical protein ILYODFUR_001977 [Ilyodon furcidens]|uniref:Uncharacterized protein n=1 Tax=Ilyodon furcidens TaxID=33524 RepID=A0ABV0STI9_9TELE